MDEHTPAPSSRSDLSPILETILFQLEQLSPPPQKLLTTREAAELLGIKPQTLSLWRTRNYGPVYRKMGNSVRYDIDDVKRFGSVVNRRPTEKLSFQIL